MSEHRDTTAALAWNQIALDLPASWEISGMGKNYLQFDNGERPVMELKWRAKGRNPSTEAGFKRLAKRIRQTSRVRITAAPTPRAWKKSLARFAHQCFAWEGPGVDGLGAALYCEKCGASTILQFFTQPAKQDSKTLLEVHAPDVLASFTDHEPPEAVVYRVYDIRARIPRRFRLETYAFQPGRFHLAFEGPAQRLELTRLAPASLLLEEHCLAELARRRFGDKLPAAAEPDRETEGFAAFRAPPAGLWRNPVLAQAFRKRPHHALDVRHDPEHDRILAVSLDSLAPADEDLMAWLDEHFATE
jgi:hypothetical protein